MYESETMQAMWALRFHKKHNPVVCQNINTQHRPVFWLHKRSGFIGTIVTDTSKKGKPTNSEFITLIADRLQLQLKSSEVANF